MSCTQRYQLELSWSSRNAINKDGDGVFSGSGYLHFDMGKIRFMLFYFTLSLVM